MTVIDPALTEYLSIAKLFLPPEARSGRAEGVGFMRMFLCSLAVQESLTDCTPESMVCPDVGLRLSRRYCRWIVHVRPTAPAAIRGTSMPYSRWNTPVVVLVMHAKLR